MRRCRCRVPVEQALKDANLKLTDINEVILVGGSTRIPAVQVRAPRPSARAHVQPCALCRLQQSSHLSSVAAAQAASVPAGPGAEAQRPATQPDGQPRRGGRPGRRRAGWRAGR